MTTDLVPAGITEKLFFLHFAEKRFFGQPSPLHIHDIITVNTVNIANIETVGQSDLIFWLNS